MRHVENVDRYIKIRFIPSIQWWHIWFMGPGGSYLLVAYKHFDDIIRLP